MHHVRSRTLNAAVAGSLLMLATIPGCGSREDAAFRASVDRVLQHAANLDRGINDAYPRARDSVVTAFQKEVDALPVARSRKLRFLAVRLRVLAGAAGQRVLAQDLFEETARVYSESVRHAGNTAKSQAEADSATRAALEEAGRTLGLFNEDWQVVAEAERVALGTHGLWDYLNSILASAPSESAGVRSWRAGMDSVRAAREAYVRQELKLFR